jgi:hypothetical protein
MKNYSKPIILPNEELAEGVYAASGCWTITGWEHQANLDTGRNDYRFQLSAQHNGESGHGTKYTIKVTFDQLVNYESCATASYVSGNGTDTLILTRLNGATNPNEGVGFGDLYVKYAGSGSNPDAISITYVTMTD